MSSSLFTLYPSTESSPNTMLQKKQWKTSQWSHYLWMLRVTHTVLLLSAGGRRNPVAGSFCSPKLSAVGEHTTGWDLASLSFPGCGTYTTSHIWESTITRFPYDITWTLCTSWFIILHLQSLPTKSTTTAKIHSLRRGEKHLPSTFLEFAIYFSHY